MGKLDKFNSESYRLGAMKSTIRGIFEYSKKRKAEIGAENVFDYSIGNPNVPAPKAVTDYIVNAVTHGDQAELHGYTSAQGDAIARQKIADSLNKDITVTQLSGDNIYFTCGASSSLCIALGTIITKRSDEVVVIAPFFPEYSVYIDCMGGTMRMANSIEGTFKLDLDSIEKSLNENTRGILVNYPNNPTGVVISADEMKALADLIKRKSEEYGTIIYIISDEPYRELVYDGDKLACMFNYYDNTIMCYSYSKSLSLAGARIGYVAVSPNATDSQELYTAVCGAGRKLGYINAPSMFQRLVSDLAGTTVDISIYENTRNFFYDALTEMGFTVVKPQGAFYMFVKCSCDDANEFCEMAKKHELLFVPSNDFGVTGYVRIAYCKTREEIERSLPNFKALAKECFGK